MGLAFIGRFFPLPNQRANTKMNRTEQNKTKQSKAKSNKTSQPQRKPRIGAQTPQNPTNQHTGRLEELQHFAAARGDDEGHLECLLGRPDGATRCGGLRAVCLGHFFIPPGCLSDIAPRGILQKITQRTAKAAAKHTPPPRQNPAAPKQPQPPHSHGHSPGRPAEDQTAPQPRCADRPNPAPNSKTAPWLCCSQTPLRPRLCPTAQTPPQIPKQRPGCAAPKPHCAHHCAQPPKPRPKYQNSALAVLRKPSVGIELVYRFAPAVMAQVGGAGCALL